MNRHGIMKTTGGVMMKIAIGKAFPKYFDALYPEEFELFSGLSRKVCKFLC